MTLPSTPEDLGAAFKNLQTRLRQYLRRRVADPALADDLLQEVFVKAATAMGASHAPQNLTGWLYAAARTTVIDYYRAAKPDTVELDEDYPEQELDDEQLHQELALCLKPMVQQLPAIYRDTLIATEFEGKTLQCVAEEQGFSLSAIKSRASRGRFMLKEKLLACCKVETANGLVADYQPRSSDSCACS